MKGAALFLGSILLALPAHGGQPLAGPYRAEVLRVLDGDSLEARVTVWLGEDVTTTVRLEGIDAAELHAPCATARLAAIAARGYLTAHLTGSTVTLTDIRTDKYGGRVVARVADAEGADVSAALLTAGLVRPYAGRRPDWCGGN